MKNDSVLITALVIGALIMSKRSKETRGIRNNNPGNIRAVGIPWVGKTGQDKSGFVVFDTPVNGIRALARNLWTYYHKYGLDTVHDIISRWAPPSENPTEKYVRNVAKHAGVTPKQRLDMPRHVAKIVEAIIAFENGTNPYSAGQIAQGINKAGWPNPPSVA